MDKLVTPSTLPGFMELAPDDQILFDRIKYTLEDTYRLFGFFPIDTPVLEKSEILLAKAGGETEKQIYRFNKGDTDITMRFDLTVPLAKYVAQNYNSLVFPFKRYQIGKVYRGERAQRGRFREFYQADIDIIGNNELSILNDAEIPSIIYTALTRLGLDDFTIRINNRKLLNGLFEMLSLSEISGDILHIIDKIDKIGKENVKSELLSLGIEEATMTKLIDSLCFKGTKQQVLEMLLAYCGKNEKFDTGYNELKEIVYYISKFGVPDNNYEIDLTIARGLDYYTGTVYETTFNPHPEIGSICSGGRYDNLAAYYTKNKLPGVGMSIGLTRLFYILSDKNYLNKSLCYPADVLIISMTEDMTAAVEISAKMRNSAISTQLFMEKKKFKQMISYADKLSIPFVVFLGEDELVSNQLTLKNMANGEQVKVELDEAVRIIKSQLAARSVEKCISID